MDKVKLFLPILTLLLGIKIVKSQNICFSDFTNLHSEGTRLDFKEIHLKNLKVTNKQGPDKLSMQEYQIYQLNQKYNIKHYRRKYENDLFQDTIQVLDRKIPVTELLASFGFSQLGANHLLLIEKTYEMEFNQHKYLLLLLWDFKGTTVGKFHYPILVNLDNLNEIHYIGNKGKMYYKGGTLRFYPDYLGDFNQDGILDYLTWDYENNKIEFNTLIDGKFVLKPDKYLFLNKTKKELGDPIHLIKTIYWINNDESSWFYKIHYKRETNNSCELNTLPYPQKITLYIE